jgi:hypothetical protein
VAASDMVVEVGVDSSHDQLAEACPWVIQLVAGQLGIAVEELQSTENPKDVVGKGLRYEHSQL